MKSFEENRQFILEGKAFLGIELGSTRIKAVLIGGDYQPLATGSFTWENQWVDGIWTYNLEDALKGVQSAYGALSASVEEQYHLRLKKLAGLGISGMMHGYLPFDEQGKLLVPFRTWRNTITAQAADELTGLLNFAIPQRYSIAHLYQAILNGEAHVPHVHTLTTLAGYIHTRLTGKRVLGVGEASGMFPVDESKNYDKVRLDLFNAHIKPHGFPWTLEDLLPECLVAGEAAGVLTPEGAELLDASGMLEPGVPCCPPEGDAGTGMVATNAVLPGTGNVSAGTSIFAMLVLEKALLNLHPEIDMVSTPAGNPVAMVHGNNCTTDLNIWVSMFQSFMKQLGLETSPDALYPAFYQAALLAEPEAGGLLSCGYYSGEHITGFEEGRPFLVQTSGSRFTFSNLARSLLFSSLATLSLGMEVLKQEGVRVHTMMGHGGLFKGGEAAQRFMAAALNAPVSVMGTAGEGGAWGIALLAAYRTCRNQGESLGAFLEHRVFKAMQINQCQPHAEDVAGFLTYLARFKAGLQVEAAAVAHLE